MTPAGLLFSLTVVALLESLAFAGLRRALAADEHPRRGVILAVIYWAASAVVLGAAVWAPLFGGRDVDNEPRLPEAVIVAAMALYLPKVGLAALMVIDLTRRASAWWCWRVLAWRAPAPDAWLTRTRLLPRVGFALAALTFAAIAWGVTLGKSDVRVYRHVIRSASLSPAFDGLRVVHISDIHASSLGSAGPRLADRMVAAVNAERPDLILYTGDYGQASDLDHGPDILGRLQARLGKFAVLGNHDFGGRERAADNWASPEDKVAKIEALARGFRSAHFTLLVNDAAVLSRQSGAIAVLGVGVYDPHHGFDDADLARAESRAGNVPFRLLIAHSPHYWERAVQGQRTIDLTLVGHTHGAQVGIGVGPLVWSPASIEFSRWGGLYREGTQFLNVNRGTGYVGLPFRLNMPADVSVIVVRSESAARSGGA